MKCQYIRFTWMDIIYRSRRSISTNTIFSAETPAGRKLFKSKREQSILFRLTEYPGTTEKPFAIGFPQGWAGISTCLPRPSRKKRPGAPINTAIPGETVIPTAIKRITNHALPGGCRLIRITIILKQDHPMGFMKWPGI